MIPRQPGTVGSLALAVFHEWDPDQIFVLVTVYIDESHTHGGAPFMIMAGRVGTLAHWRSFDKKWNGHLKKFGVEYFHSKHARNRSGPFAGMRMEDVNAFVKKANRFRVSERDYREHYRGGTHPRHQPIASMYGMCFLSCLVDIPRRAAAYVKKEKVQVNFVLELGHKNCGDAVRIFAECKEGAPSDLRDILGTIALGAKREFPGLQAADVVALGGAIAEMRSMPVITVPADATLDELRQQIDNETPSFRFELTPEVLKEFKRKMIADEEARRQFWINGRKDRPSS